MNELQIFQYSDRQVRTLLKDGEPWFVAKDICDVLDIENPSDAIKRLDEDERARFNLGRQGETNIVSESGLYALTLGSKKPEAKPFKRWITHEVIPQIRKTGSYSLQKPQCVEDLIIMQAKSMKELRAQVKQITDTQQAIKDAVISEPDNWRRDIYHKMNKIAQAIGPDKFKDVRTESYKLLDERAHADLNRRLFNYRARLLAQGQSKTAIDKANVMDIIDQDPKLREIYGKIVAEYLIKYVA